MCVIRLSERCYRNPASEGDQGKPNVRVTRPLYDIPYMYEAREFLRKKLIGKKVTRANWHKFLLKCRTQINDH